MSRTLKIFSLILLVSSLSLACSKSESQKTQETVDSLNQVDLPRSWAITEELGQLGYQFDSLGIPKAPKHPSHENMDRATILLNEYIQVGNRILVGAAKPGVFYAGKSIVESNIKQSKAMLEAIATYRAAKLDQDISDALIKVNQKIDAEVKADLQKISQQIESIAKEDKIEVAVTENKKAIADSRARSARAIANMKSIETVKSAQTRLSELRNSLENFLESADGKRKITGNPTQEAQNILHRALVETKDLQNDLDDQANTLKNTDENVILDKLEFENPFNEDLAI